MNTTHLVHVVARFLLTGLSVLIVAAVLPGMQVQRYRDAVWFAVVVAVLNVVAWRLLGLLTVPFTALTAGVGYFIVNGVVFLVAQKAARGVRISGCFVAAIAAALVGFVNSVLSEMLR
jgi:putative membrane protein